MQYYSSDLFQPFKNVQTILNSRTIQEWAAGQMWPNVCSVPTPDLELFY